MKGVCQSHLRILNNTSDLLSAMPPAFPDSKAISHRLVLLDVGGRSFKVWTGTLLRFPDSLLAKMLYEFPELIEHGEALYVDRNPKYFEWILEIYRNGDFDCCMPEAPEERLQRELDFYQLPSLRDLDIRPLVTVEFGCRLRSIMEDIVTEINHRGFHRFFPLEVYIYYKYTKDHSFDGQQLVLRCPSHVGRIVNPPTDEHLAFYEALWGNQQAYGPWSWTNPIEIQCTEYPGYVTIETMGESLLIKRFDKEEMRRIGQEAWKHGLHIEHRLSKHLICARKVEIDYLYIHRK